MSDRVSRNSPIDRAGRSAPGCIGEFRPSRRQFARAGTFVAGGVVGVSLLVPIVGFLASPLFGPGRPLVERRLGDVGDLANREPRRFVVDFPEGAWGTQELPYGVWVVRFGSRLKVFSNICTHMQCAVRYEPRLRQFLCPCHGGLYDLEGTNVGGPPPRPLPEYEHRLQGSVLFVRNRLTERI
jgi:menaquinol-cytochrome c reductase iron-sulfur subunit